jgi:hypothetical protein
MATPENIHQIYIGNPITSNVSSDLMYFGQSPYGITNDAAMTFVNFAAQFSPVMSFPFIVGAKGPYTTIQSAINAASAVATMTQQQQVLINPGTYTENVTLLDYVHCSSFGASDVAVTINGNATYTSSVAGGILSLDSLSFTATNAGLPAVSVAGTSTCTLNMDNCTFTGQAGPCFSFNNPNATVFKSNSTDFAPSGQQIFNVAAGLITINGCLIVSTDTASTISGGTVEILGGFVTDAFVISAGSGVFINNSVIQSNNNLSTFTIATGAEVIALNSSIDCSAASGYWATGTGTLIYNALTTGLGSATSINPTVGAFSLPLLVGGLSFNGGLNTFTTSGAFSVIQTYTGTTNVTFPTTGTLATTSQIPSVVTPLPLNSGGTSADLTASNGGIFYSTASAGAILAGTATANRMLQSGASTTPAWSTTTWPATSTINQILYSSAANTIVGLATATTAVLTTAAGVPTWASQLSLGLGGTNSVLTAVAGAVAYSSATAIAFSAAGTAGQLLQSGGTGTPTWTSSPAVTTLAVGAASSGLGQIQVSAVSSSANIATTTWSAAANTSQFISAKSNGTSVGSYTALAINNPIGQWQSYGSDGTQFTLSSSIVSYVSGPVSIGVVPGTLIFNTANAAGVLTQGMSLNQLQQLSVAGQISAPSLALSTPLPVISGGTGSATVNGAGINLQTTGTWVPTLSPATGAFGSITYAVQTASYIQIGKLIFFNVAISLSAFTIGTASGVITITGLPAAAAAGTNGINPILYRFINCPASVLQLVSVISAGASVINIYEMSSQNAAYTPLPASTIEPTSAIYISGSYVSV